LVVALFAMIVVAAILFARRLSVEASTTPGQRRSSVSRVAMPLAFAGAALVLIAVALFLVAVNILFGLILCVAFVVSVNLVILRARRSRQYGLLTVLASAATHRMPLGPAMR